LTWSSVTSAAPSPPAENLSTINKLNNQGGLEGGTQNINIDEGFIFDEGQHLTEQNIHRYERFKESVELLIVKVRF
jgi:hypothetical protein